MKYTASQVIKRALDLADIANTSFLTHEELTRYINDAWITVYQWLINAGDKQFVVEAYLSPANHSLYTSYELPDDLYQLRSVGDRYGNLITRKSDSEDAGYEIVNDELRIYGSYSDVIITYYKTPTYISFPEEEIDVNYNPTLYCKNSILDKEGNVYNVLTGELIASLSNKVQYLGNGVYISENKVYNFSNEVVNELPENVYIHSDKDGVLYYQILEDGKYSAPLHIITNNPLFTNIEYESDGYPLYITSYMDRGEWVYYDVVSKGITIYKEDEDEEFDIPTTGSIIHWMSDFDNKPCFYVVNNNRVEVYTYDDNGNVEFDVLRYRLNYPRAYLDYGVIDSNGSYNTLKSTIPDTDFNFPNELYLSLLCTDLALRFAMKMNANTDGLNNLYTNMQYTFMNTLGQDADYPRIKNVY